MLLLSFCAAPRANHALRTVPPDLLAPYTAAHDAAVWGTLQVCLGATAEDEACPARDIALFPASLGGRTVAGHAHRPSGAGWADALTVLRERCPAFSDWAVRCLTDARGPACLRTASEARRLLVAEGGPDVPSWELVVQGARPPDLKGSPSPVNGGMGGNTVRRAHGTFSSATTCCCFLCRHPTVRSRAPWPVRMPLHGSKPSQATPTPRSPPRQC